MIKKELDKNIAILTRIYEIAGSVALSRKKKWITREHVLEWLYEIAEMIQPEE